MIKKVLNIIDTIEKDVVKADREYQEMAERNKITIAEARKRMELKRKKFDEKRYNVTSM